MSTDGEVGRPFDLGVDVSKRKRRYFTRLRVGGLFIQFSKHEGSIRWVVV